MCMLGGKDLHGDDWRSEETRLWIFAHLFCSSLLQAKTLQKSAKRCEGIHRAVPFT
jgi:hypothetical protein